MSGQQPTNEDVLGKIIELTSSHYDNNDQPFLLSALGNCLLQEFPDLKAVLQGRSLSDVITKIPNMTLVRHSKYPQRVAAAYKDDEQRIQGLIENIGENEKISSVLQPERLQRALVYAFQQDPKEGDEVYVSIGPRIHYRVIPRRLDRVEKEFLIPKDLLVPNRIFQEINELSPESRKQLVTNISRWLEGNSIPLRSCYFIRQTYNSNNLLLKLIEAQPTEIRSRLIIPIDVILRLASDN